MLTEETGDPEFPAREALARLDALHTGLTRIALEGGDLAGIAAEVGRVLDVGVAVTSTDGRERASALSEDQLRMLTEHDLVDPTGRLRVERMGIDGVPVAGGEARTLRVAAGGQNLARLVCVRLTARLAPDDVQALERAAAVAALLITREEAVTAVETKYQGDFLRDLLLRRTADPAYVAEHADTLGWDLRRPMVVLTAELDPIDARVPAEQWRAWQKRFSAGWRQVCSGLGEGIPTVDFSSEVVTLLPVDADPGPPPAATSCGGPSPRSPGTRAAGDGSSRQGSAARCPTSTPCPVPMPRHGGRSRWAAGSPGAAARRSSTSSACTGCSRSSRTRRSWTPSSATRWARSPRPPPRPPSCARPCRSCSTRTSPWPRRPGCSSSTTTRCATRVAKLERLLGPLSTDPNLRLDVAVALQALRIVGRPGGT
ncbi:hypothetical protein [Pseudonocardia sp. ICBG601]|uniref:hypothetical protein n=1 Tax=Pseudonocardia sp. ICBG601 TaxID=2846759 RepID=UPI0021F5D3F6|nr:hypothetical protein [Pseudonocardia sp. ICBG601]